MAKAAKRQSKQAPADRFEAVAKSHGCDVDKEQFEAMLGKIARTKPTMKPAVAKRRKK